MAPSVARPMGVRRLPRFDSRRMDGRRVAEPNRCLLCDGCLSGTVVVPTTPGDPTNYRYAHRRCLDVVTKAAGGN